MERRYEYKATTIFKKSQMDLYKHVAQASVQTFKKDGFFFFALLKNGLICICNISSFYNSNLRTLATTVAVIQTILLRRLHSAGNTRARVHVPSILHGPIIRSH